MKDILQIARKEFKDTIRDKRTLMAMIVVPLLLFPVIFSLVGGLQSESMEKAMSRELKIAVVGSDVPVELEEQLKAGNNIRLVSFSQDTSYRRYVRGDSLDAAVVVPPDFNSKVHQMKTGNLQLYFQSTQEGVERRLTSMLDRYEAGLRKERLARLNIAEETIQPVRIEKVDLATMQEKIGKYIGGFIPYIFIIFCFIGAMYPAIDLFTGEKERGTIETILTSPVRRLHILTGKMSVVVATGIISALLAIVGLFAGLNFNDTLPAEITKVTGDILQPGFIFLLLSMLIPLTIFFAGILIPISIYAKSFKEAQSIITPINILVILPGIVGLLPGIELTLQTALIPVVNIALATKDIVAGTIDYGLLAAVYGSLILFAVLTVAFSVRYFGKETNILRA
jgi:sodium transport system permease protein